MNDPVSSRPKGLSFIKNLPSLEVLFRSYRLWRGREFISVVDHEEVEKNVIDDGQMTSRYAFMVIMACAIAILGLLLSSPAVIIGAMLISPLMGPIMSLGFSLCTLNFRQMKKSLEAIVIGIILALMISAVVVVISPISDPTPEIMARTQPNLFDLLVAIFSGLAGGYATIKQKGAAIVGVAIATALMPPLAVVGYGLSTNSWAIAQGAFFLFMTNLLAISLSVTLLAKLYGFGVHTSRKQTVLQTGLVFMVFAVLSIPLGLSLSKIAYQSYITKTTKAEIENYFLKSSSRISNFSIAFKPNDEIGVDCIMITDTYAPDAETEIHKNLENKLSKTIHISLDQIVVAKHEQDKVEKEQIEERIAETALVNPLQSKPLVSTAQEEMTQAVKSAVFFPLQSINVDMENAIISIYPKPSKRIGLNIFRDIEESLQARFPDWHVSVIPPAQALPFVYFDIGKETLSQEETEKIKDIIWTLRHWEVSDAAVVGYASTVGEYERFNNTSLAYRRAQTVMNLLDQGGIKAVARADYKAFAQTREELNFGINSLQRVEIRIIKDADLPSEQ